MLRISLTGQRRSLRPSGVPLKRAVFLGFALMVTAAAIAAGSTDFIILEHAGRVRRVIPLRDGFRLLYVHSSEKQPWESVFGISTGGALVLKTMRVRSLGPGVPSDVEPGWEFYIKDGYLVYDRINKEFPYLDFKVSGISPHYLIVGRERFNLVDMFGDSAVVRVRAVPALFR